jgi:hypothetical protein
MHNAKQNDDFMISRTLSLIHNNEDMKFSALIPVAFAVCRVAALKKAWFHDAV